jgi:transposase-like protein
MSKTSLPYAPEFRRQMIELVRAGPDPEDLAREFEPTSQSIRNWVSQADLSEGRRDEKVEPTAFTPAEEGICHSLMRSTSSCVSRSFVRS